MAEYMDQLDMIGNPVRDDQLRVRLSHTVLSCPSSRPRLNLVLTHRSSRFPQ